MTDAAKDMPVEAAEITAALVRLKQETDDSNPLTAYAGIDPGLRRERAVFADVRVLLAAYEDAMKVVATALAWADAPLSDIDSADDNLAHAVTVYQRATEERTTP